MHVAKSSLETWSVPEQVPGAVCALSVAGSTGSEKVIAWLARRTTSVSELTKADGAIVTDHYEVVAGARRLTAAQAVVAEGVEIDPVPIAILEPGDDAAALEASLIENLNRLPPDEVTCWETFSRLIKAGRAPEQIAATFGMSDVAVKRTLALGNLLPRLRGLYRKGEIEITSGSASHYVFSNVFEVASKSAPYEKVVAGKNLEYVIEVLRTEGQSAWFACPHDEFVILMDGEVRIDFIKLDNPPKNGTGTVSAGEHPQGRAMGHVVLRRGHQALLPAGCAYRFRSNVNIDAGAAHVCSVVQTHV